MDINTKFAIQKNWIPTRYLNQIDKTNSIMENYISRRKDIYEDNVEDIESEAREISISTSYKEI